MTAAQQAVVTAQQALAPSAASMVSFTSMTRAALKAAMGDQSPAQVSYGIAPNKTPMTLTTEQKAPRHTMGARQKAAVKGVVAPASSAREIDMEEGEQPARFNARRALLSDERSARTT